MKRNPNFEKLTPKYLFPEINSRKRKFFANHPSASLINLGVGDTTEPIPKCIANALSHFSIKMSTHEGYSGYGPEQGIKNLREKIASSIYSNKIAPEDIFVSDGAKCDLGRLQILFGKEVSIAVQDPSYPVYIEGSLIQGVEKILKMPCSPENGFFPSLNLLPKVNLIYFCSPNNPTGMAATRSQLEELVAFAESNQSVIIFDSAYANFIQDPNLPKSIFEIKGAEKVAIEIGSFSKLAGFTGIRLGWTVIPEGLKYEDGRSIKADWHRLTSTLFNGASNIAQQGGCAVLEQDGLQEIACIVKFYQENACILKDALESVGHTVFGGINAPYLWVRFKGQNSWDVFQHFLEKYHIVTTPGAGFGPGGDEYIRFSAFGRREDILNTSIRIKKAQVA